MVHAWVLCNDLKDLPHLGLHGDEAGVLLRANLAAQAACILLREETLGHDMEEIDIERECERKNH